MGSPAADILLVDPFSITSNSPNEEAQRGGGACPGPQSTASSLRFLSVADCLLAPIFILSSVVKAL